MRRTSILAVAFGAALLGAAPAPAVTSFLETWAKIPSYTTAIKVHETKGSDVQDRTYRYAYLKPHYAKIDITGGPGKGGGAVWTGGDSVSGHQGGFLSGIHLKVGIKDGRATSLRGDTMDTASFENMAEALKSATSVTVKEETVDGKPCDVASFPYTDSNGATRREIALSRATHLPVRRTTLAGETAVKIEDFSDINTAANLKPDDFHG